MLLIGIVPPPADPSLASAAYGGMLGEGWTVEAYNDPRDIPDDVAAEAEFLVLPPGSGTIDAAALSRMPKLRLIQVPGHGFDHVDVAAATAAGVSVATVASSGAEAHTVAEMAILLAGAASRRILPGDRAVREGRWGTLTMLQGGIFELAGKTIGLVGLGRIGREVAKRARAFDMRVIYHDVFRLPPEQEREVGVEFRELDALLGEADVVSLHAPLTPETRGLINDRTLGLMKPMAVLVNTARGPLVDAAALARALRDGTIRAAAIDVFDPEPPPPDLPLYELDNVVLQPHLAGVTGESILRIIAAAMENCRRVARGEDPLDVVTEGSSH
ncbi:MAG: NAD(P)-dependent oxidoreductase [Actinomycetota bacterium]